jgi:integrin beta 3
MTPEELAAIVHGMTPVIRDYVARMVGPLAHRMTVAETQLAAVVTQTTAVGPLRERVAVLETLAPVPGPPGPAGRDGDNGVDGLGFEDLSVTQRDERSFVITAAQGARVKEIGTASFPVALYRGVWTEGKTYDPGDSVTWSGSEWHCQTTTATKPGDGSKAWTLKVKRGRDGKDGKDGGPGPQGPAGRDWQQVFDDNRRR